MEVSIKIMIPDGYVLACDYMRKPLMGEMFLCVDGIIRTVGNNVSYNGLYAIVKPKEPEWVWPRHIKAKWMVCNEDMQWIICDCEPILFPSYYGSYWKYDSNSRLHLIGTADIVKMIGFIPPPVPNNDWRLSKRMNPNYWEYP